MHVEDWLGRDNKLGIDIWKKKYRFDNESFDEWLDRVSGDGPDAQSIRRLILDKKFLFGGRILANRGLQKKGIKVTYSNCYVLSPPEDSIESIFETAGKLARTFSYGGGAGEVMNLNKRTDISYNSPWSRYRWDRIRDMDNKDVGEFRCTCTNIDPVFGRRTDWDITAMNYKDDGTSINCTMGVRATGTGDTYVVLPMRSSPSASDAVNTKYVLDQVARKQDKFSLYEHTITVKATPVASFNFSLTVLNQSPTAFTLPSLYSYLGSGELDYKQCTGVGWLNRQSIDLIGIRGGNPTELYFQGVNRVEGDMDVRVSIDWTQVEVLITDKVLQIV